MKDSRDAIILTITKLTRDTAFNCMFHQYIRPPRFITIINTVTTTTIAENNDIPVNSNVAIKITANDKLIDAYVSFQIVKYCS